jgi:hypothetical protein
MTPERFPPVRASLPVGVFQANQVPSPHFAQQAASAMEIAKEHGYREVSLVKIDKPHGPSPTTCCNTSPR